MNATIKTLGYKGGSYIVTRIQSIINSNKVNTSHWTGHLIYSGGIQPKQPLESILTENSKFQTNKLRIRLIKEGLLKPRCSSCKNDTWLGKPISLELDHINGINNDHRLDNLRLLCPNCHAMTATYRGRNKRSVSVQSI